MTYGLKYYGEFVSRYYGVEWRVEIAEKDYEGESSKMLFDGSEPLSITWEDGEDEFFEPIKASEATLKIMSTENFQYMSLFTSDARKFRMSIYRYTKLFWRGFITADLYTETFEKPPYFVSVKAMDGFSILSSTTFDTPYVGNKSLREILEMVLDVMDLDLPIEEWIGLRGESMSEDLTVLEQTYINIDRLTEISEEVTYQDLLKLCLTPFGAQIFQSNGYLNIRRVVDLYNEDRPVSYAYIAPESLVTQDNQKIVTHNGEEIDLFYFRPEKQSIWDGDHEIIMTSESELEINPAAREMSVIVENQSTDNVASAIGLFDLNQWSAYEGAELPVSSWLSFPLSSNSITVGVVDGATEANKWVYYNGVYVEQSTTAFTMSYSVDFASWIEDSLLGSMIIAARIDIRIEANNGTIYMLKKSSGEWEEFEGTEILTESWSTGYSSEVTSEEIEIPGFIAAGILKIGLHIQPAEFVEGFNKPLFTLQNITITADSELALEVFEESNIVANLDNNIDLSATLNISDAPGTINGSLFTSIYLKDGDDLPTIFWDDYRYENPYSLVNHMLDSMMLLRQQATTMLSAKIFSPNHLDMNTLIEDDKYLNKVFYTNAIEIDCFGDEYSATLIELPKYYDDTPSRSVALYTTLETVPNRTVRVDDRLFFLFWADKEAVSFDVIKKTYTTLQDNVALTTLPSDLYSSDKFSILAYETVDGEAVRSFLATSKTGLFEYSLVTTDYTFAQHIISIYDYIIVLGTTEDEEDDSISRNVNIYEPGDNNELTLIAQASTDYADTPEAIYTVVIDQYTFALNTAYKAYIFDLNNSMTEYLCALESGASVRALSSVFIAYNVGNAFKVLRRTPTAADMSTVLTLDSAVAFVDVTFGEVAYAINDVVTIWIYNKDITYTVDYTFTGITSMHYIGVDLYVICGVNIYKVQR